MMKILLEADRGTDPTEVYGVRSFTTKDDGTIVVTRQKPGYDDHRTEDVEYGWEYNVVEMVPEDNARVR